jgi:hypothetical protein
VDPQLSLTPAGLTNNQLDRLTAYAKRASKLALEDLQEVARRHLQDTIAAHQHNPFVNLRLAQALCDTIQQLATNWHTLRPEARPWLSGAILHFAKSDDDGFSVCYMSDATRCLRKKRAPRQFLRVFEGRGGAFNQG